MRTLTEFEAALVSGGVKPIDDGGSVSPLYVVAGVGSFGGPFGSFLWASGGWGSTPHHDGGSYSGDPSTGQGYTYGNTQFLPLGQTYASSSPHVIIDDIYATIMQYRSDTYEVGIEVNVANISTNHGVTTANFSYGYIGAGPAVTPGDLAQIQIQSPYNVHSHLSYSLNASPQDLATLQSNMASIPTAFTMIVNGGGHLTVYTGSGGARLLGLDYNDGDVVTSSGPQVKAFIVN